MSGQRITSNLDTNPFDKPSDEILAKLAPEKKTEIEKLFKLAKEERDRSYKELKEQALKDKRITQEQIQERQKKIDEEISQLYSRSSPIPAIETGKNGIVPLKHKNKLAFIDRKSTRLNSSHIPLSRMPSSA